MPGGSCASRRPVPHDILLAMPIIERLNAALSGRYHIERELGEGGMATVYLAADVRHERQVALKVLKPELAAVVGADRFLAEIKTTANLQHPHILPLFDSGEADGFLFYVMPYVEGESLRERLDRETQLPVEEAIRIGAAAAHALQAAHDRGVVHRDIKPANILLSGGEPLVADFGIALAVTAGGGGRLTETGLSLGTPYYMSPEQATGDRTVGPASDVYALGCVLYEMLVGEPPYVGSTAQAVLGRILTEEPRRPTAVRTSVPAHVEGAVLKALEKLPADRFRTPKELASALGDPGFRHGGESVGAASRATGEAGPWKAVAIALALVTALLLPNALGEMLGGAESAAAPAVFQLGLGTLEWGDDMAISDDGTMFAVVARAPGDPEQQVWVRRIDEVDFRPVSGTERATEVEFSPDGEWLVFIHDEREALLRVAVGGGGSIPILDVDSISPHDPHWGADGTIAFTGSSGIGVVSGTGEGGARIIERGLQHPQPHMLPDGSGVLASDAEAVWLIDLATDSATRLIPGAVSAQYLSTGHLVYGSTSGGLFVVPFDLSRHEVTGGPIPVLDGPPLVGIQGGYDVSRDGTLVYARGVTSTFGIAIEHRLLFLDRQGRPDTVRITPRTIYDPAISPDGRYVAYATYVGRDTQNGQIQVLDLMTGSTPDITSEGSNYQPIWSPDGSRIAFDSRRDGTHAADLFVASADGRGGVVPLLGGPQMQVALDWIGDMLVVGDRSAGNRDLRILHLSEDSMPSVTTYLEADYREDAVSVSPDGTLAAYVSNETGSSEVYVRGFPEPVGKWRISVDGGRNPRWSPSGDELYFARSAPGPDSVFAVSVRRDPETSFGDPELLFATVIDGGWDVGPDGRFLVSQGADGDAVDEGSGGELRFLVVLNWFEEIRDRVGEGR